MTFPPFKLERYFAQHEFTAAHMASSSDAESMTLHELLALAPEHRAALEDLWLGYSDATGLPALRAAIAATYTTIGVDDVLTHTGAEEPIFNFCQAWLRPGDHVIVHTPGYQSLYGVPEALGCDVSRWQARFERGWRLDLDELAALLRPTTRAIIVNSPHNPTGFQLTAAEQATILDLARARGIVVFSDEVYRGLELAPADRLPAACDRYERAVSLGVLSKAHGLAGLRVGWIACRDAELMRAMRAQKDYTTICGSVVSETLAVIALQHEAAIMTRNRDLVRANWGLAAAFVDRHADVLEVVPPRGGTMIFPRARAGGGLDVPTWIAALRADRSVLLVGGEHFDMPTSYLRVGLGRRSFPEVLGLVEDHLDEHLRTIRAARAR